MPLPKVPQRTTSGFSFSIVRRALMESMALRQFGMSEVHEVLAFFGSDPPTCAFCGATPIQRWDHLVPVTKGGDTVLGNVVPSCAKCDDSKGDRPFDEWAMSSVPGSPASRGVLGIEGRLTNIREYVGKYAYRSKTPEERLTADEMRQLETLRDDLVRLRSDFDRLVAAFRQRTGQH